MISSTSPPEQNARPSPRSTTTRVSSRCGISAKKSRRSAYDLKVSALSRSGRLNVIVATPSRRSTRKCFQSCGERGGPPKRAHGSYPRAVMRPRPMSSGDGERERRWSRMRIAVIGGGPGGLYFTALAQQLGPDHEITVWERNAADDTFGFGVVFSDETLGGIEHADPAVHAAMQREFARLGRHRRPLQGRGDHQRRPRLRGDEPAPAARDPPGALPRARRRRCTSAPRPPTSTSSPRRTTWSSPPTASTPRSARGTPTPSGRRSTCATAATSGSAPTRSSTRSRSTSARRRTA